MKENNSDRAHNKNLDIWGEEGANFLEYALLGTLIFAVALIAVRYLGQNVSVQFSTISEQIS